MLILIFLLYFLIATTFTLSKALVTVFSPLVLITLRFLIGGGLLLFGALIFYPKKIFNIEKQDYKDFVQVALALYCFGFILDNYAIIYLESSFSSLIYNLSPFFTAILSYFIFKRRLLLSQVLGLCIGFLSVSALFLNDFYFYDFFKTCSTQILLIGAYIALLIAVVASAYGWIIFEKLLNRGYESIMVHCVGLLGAGFLSLFLIVLSVIFEIPLSTCSSINPITVLGSPFLDLLLLVIISHVICALLYGSLLTVYSPTLISFAGCITPLFVALFGFIFLNESVTWHFFAATIGVSGGLFLFYKNEGTKGI
jgi:drug/metabolite transporter (DMT)-like permease